MLIEEVRAVTGMNYREITHALFVEGYPQDADATTVDPDRAREYTLPLTHYRARVPKFDQLQTLENDVAYLLKRPAHTLVIADLGLLDREPDEFGQFVAVPRAGLSWNRRKGPLDNLVITYASTWPPYGELVEAGLVDLFKWQYGWFWEQGLFQRGSHGFPDTFPIETLLEQRIRRLEIAFEGLSYLLHRKPRGHPVPEDLANALEALKVSDEELRLFCIAWGPQGLHRWRDLSEATLARCCPTPNVNPVLLPEFCRKPTEIDRNAGHSKERKFLDKSRNYQ